MKQKFKAGVVQFDVKKGQVEKNLKAVSGYLEKLASAGVSLAVLPEMFSCSFDNENLSLHADKTDPIIEKFCFFAGKNRMAIVGTLPEKQENKIYNTMVFIDVDGKVKGKYRKLHLFRLTGEHLYYTAGDEIAVIDSSFGKIGLMTCYDLRFPELARSMFLKGVHIIVVSAQWPESRKNHWRTLVSARSIENQLFMVCSNRTGIEDELQFPGMSMIYDPLGNMIADAGSYEGAVFAWVDPDIVKTARALIPCMEDRRQEIYG